MPPRLATARMASRLDGNYYGASGNSIGGTASGAGNIIAFNDGDGVDVGAYTFDTAAVDNSILSNSIYANGSLGIDLGNDGVTPNNSGPNGPNLFQNYPDSLIAASFPSNDLIAGHLSRAPMRRTRSRYSQTPRRIPRDTGRDSSC